MPSKSLEYTVSLISGASSGMGRADLTKSDAAETAVIRAVDELGGWTSSSTRLA